MSDIRDKFRHVGNYLLSNIANKALGFFSIPVYTRMLTTEEYGVFSVFIALVGIFSTLLTLSSETVISRYYFDAKDNDDFKRFVGVSARLTIFIFFINSILFISLSNWISKKLNLEILLTLAILPLCGLEVFYSFFEQINGPRLKSKKIAIVASLKAYIAFGISLAAISILQNKKYYGQVIGSLSVSLILCFYNIKQIAPYYKNAWDKKMVKYILHFSLPQVPYLLSGVILSMFGRIIVGNFTGFSNAGLYSFAANIGGLMSVLIMVTHQAWNPYYFDYLNKHNYESYDRDVKVIWKITLLAGLVLSTFGYEIGYILASKNYLPYLYMVPFFALGYIFYQWAYLYMRNAGYAKKTIWNAATVFISGSANIIISSFLVPKIGAIGAAFAFCISYFIMLVLAYVVNLKFLHIYTSRVWLMTKPLLISLPFFVVSLYLYFKKDWSYLKVILPFKILLLTIYIVLIFWSYREVLVTKIKKL